MDLIERFRYESTVLAAKSAALDIIHHAATRGAERQRLVADFLSPLLPERLGVGQGEIWSSDGQWSRQGDLIIYDRLNCPRIFAGQDSQVFPVESVAGIIEVKTSLDSQTIRKAADNIASAKALRKVGTATRISGGSITFAPVTPIIGAVFSFGLGLRDDTFKERWRAAQSNRPVDSLVDFVCVLGKLVIYRQNANMMFVADSGRDSLLVFTLVLAEALSHATFAEPNLFEYVFAGGKFLEFPPLFKD